MNQTKILSGSVQDWRDLYNAERGGNTTPLHVLDDIEFAVECLNGFARTITFTEADAAALLERIAIGIFAIVEVAPEWQEGRVAAWQLKTLSDCPYVRREKAEVWKLGMCSAREEVQAFYPNWQPEGATA